MTIDAEVPETEDTFTVCHHDHVHFFLRGVIEDLREMPLILDREEHAAGEAEEMAVLLAEVTDGRRVDHGEQLIHVIHQHAEEECLVRRAERVEEDALLKRCGEAVIDLHHRFFLHADRGWHRGEKSRESERLPLFRRISRSFAECPVLKQGIAFQSFSHLYFPSFKIESWGIGPEAR